MANAPQQRPPPVQLSATQSVLEWNNQACRCLQQGKHKEATYIFVRILKRLQTDDTRPQTQRAVPSTEEDGQEEEEAMGLKLLTFPANTELTGPQASSSSSSLAIQDTGSSHCFDLFDQSFGALFCDQELLEEANSRYLVLAFVCFNLGLCWCIQAQATTAAAAANGTTSTTKAQGQQGISVLLRFARQAYTKALVLLGKHRDDQETEDPLLLAMALYNNLGFLYQQGGQLAEAGRCSRQVQALVTRPRRAEACPMCDGNRQFFLARRRRSTIAVLGNKVLTVSPAA